MVSKMEAREDKLRPPPLGAAPWLVYTHGNCKSKKIQTFCTVSPQNNKSYIKSIPELRGKDVCGSSQGWLVLVERASKDMLSLWNPHTTKSVSLPRLMAPVIVDSCVLTSSPDCEDCVVVLFCSTSLICWCRPCIPNPHWESQRLELDGEETRLVLSVPCNGVIYGLTQTVDDDGTIKSSPVAIQVPHFNRRNYDSVDNHVLPLSQDHDKDDGSFLLHNHMREGQCCSGPNTSSMATIEGAFSLRSLPREMLNVGYSYMSRFYGCVESCGTIYFVNVHLQNPMVSQRIAAVKVWGLDLETKDWVEVKCLGDRAFFLAKHFSTWCWGGEGGVEGNCIYFLTPDIDDVYMYSLQDCSLTILSLWPNLVNPLDGAFWIMPQHQSFDVNDRLLVRQGRRTEPSTNVHRLDHKVMYAGNETSLQESLVSLLPLDMIDLISKHLHLFDYLSFRATCKSIRSTLPLPGWRTNNSLPLLLFSTIRGGLSKVMDPCLDDSRPIAIPKQPTPVDDIAIEFSKEGWLFVTVLPYSGRSSHRFFNPFTGATQDLPCHEDTFESVGFSTNPMSPECFTVGIIGISSIKIAYLLPGQEFWHFEELDRGDVEFKPAFCSPVYTDSAFYFLDREGYLGEFRLVGGKTSWKIFPRPQMGYTYFHSVHLVECDGELLSVFVETLGLSIQVFRFNRTKNEWFILKSLVNYILFLGHRSSFSIVASDPNMRNRIYLPRLYGNGIVFYSLETNMYHAFGCENSFKDFYGTTEAINNCWI